MHPLQTAAMIFFLAVGLVVSYLLLDVTKKLQACHQENDRLKMETVAVLEAYNGELRRFTEHGHAYGVVRHKATGDLILIRDKQAITAFKGVCRPEMSL